MAKHFIQTFTTVLNRTFLVKWCWSICGYIGIVIPIIIIVIIITLENNLFSYSVALVQDDSQPLGISLVNPRLTNKIAECTDLVELAMHVQKVNHFILHPVVLKQIEGIFNITAFMYFVVDSLTSCQVLVLST